MQEAEAVGNGEEWRPVIGYEGWYEVSNLGRVKRARPYSGRLAVRPLKNRGLLNPCLAQHGYLVVALYTGSNASAARRYVHQLVSDAFLGPKPDGFTINHKDGDKRNNLPSNLEHISRGDNVRHAYELGLNSRVRLSPEQVREARHLKQFHTFEYLAAKYEVGYNTIFRAVHRRTHTSNDLPGMSELRETLPVREENPPPRLRAAQAPAELHPAVNNSRKPDLLPGEDSALMYTIIPGGDVMLEVALNGAAVWAYVVETGDGLRMRFALDDWQRLNFGPGQRLPVRVPGRDDVWLFVTGTTELPPIVWVTMARRVRAAG